MGGGGGTVEGGKVKQTFLKTDREENKVSKNEKMICIQIIAQKNGREEKKDSKED